MRLLEFNMVQLKPDRVPELPAIFSESCLVDAEEDKRDMPPHLAYKMRDHGLICINSSLASHRTRRGRIS